MYIHTIPLDTYHTIPLDTSLQSGIKKEHSMVGMLMLDSCVVTRSYVRVPCLPSLAPVAGAVISY